MGTPSVPTGEGLQEGARRRPKRGSIVEARVACFDPKGRGIAPWGDVDLRLRGGLPGDLWSVKVLRRRRGAHDCHGLELLEPSTHRIQARCGHAGTCGGCAFQDFDYEGQLRTLDDEVERALRPVARAWDEVDVRPVVGASSIWNYRNKMDFTFSNRRWVEPGEPDGVERDFALGLHAPERFEKVVDIHSCSIHFTGADAILSSVRELARELRLAPWDWHRPRGTLATPRSAPWGQRRARSWSIWVTSRDASDELAPFYDALLARHPEISTLVQNVNSATRVRGDR